MAKSSDLAPCGSLVAAARQILKMEGLLPQVTQPSWLWVQRASCPLARKVILPPQARCLPNGTGWKPVLLWATGPGDVTRLGFHILISNCTITDYFNVS